jgi:hypothetical protein
MSEQECRVITKHAGSIDRNADHRHGDWLAAGFGINFCGFDWPEWRRRWLRLEAAHSNDRRVGDPAFGCGNVDAAQDNLGRSDASLSVRDGELRSSCCHA